MLHSGWGEDLTCLLLEWVPRGSLADLLDDRTRELEWREPLLKLAADAARGMLYLHSRRYYDEEKGDVASCVLHRDLKPDNCLVSDYMTIKLTDFGTARAKADDDTVLSKFVPIILHSTPECDVS